MAGLAASRVWILVILTGASNCFPMKKALDPHKGYNSNPSSGSNWEVPARGFVHAESGSSAASNPSRQSAPHEQPRYIQPSAQIGPVPALYSSDTFAAPYHLRYDGDAPAGMSFQKPPTQDSWAVQPPSPYPGGTSSSTLRFPSETKQLGLSHASPPVHFRAAFQPGEASYVEKTYDHGNYDSETEEESFPRYTPFPALNQFPAGSVLPFGPLIDSLWFRHPYIDRIMSRWYPPGTYTLSSSSLEHGKNQWHDTHYPNPASSITQQSQTFAEHEAA